jgi:hypothetical protein
MKEAYEITLLSVPLCAYPLIIFVFHAVRIVSNGNCLSVLPRTSCIRSAIPPRTSCNNFALMLHRILCSYQINGTEAGHATINEMRSDCHYGQRYGGMN